MIINLKIIIVKHNNVNLKIVFQKLVLKIKIINNKANQINNKNNQIQMLKINRLKINLNFRI